jgi:multicomponent Na+:H+ antiporter subunit E
VTGGRAGPARLALLRALLVRSLAFAGLWLVLTDGDLRSPFLAAVAVLSAVASSLVAIPPDRSGPRFSPRPGPMLRFLAFFLAASVRGGFDVARRSLTPALPIDPGYVDYEVRLPDGPGVVMLAGTVSLLPGTLSTRLDGKRLRLHVLDLGLPTEATTRRLEERIGELFGTPLEPGERVRKSP